MKFSTMVSGQEMGEQPTEPVVGGVSHTMSPWEAQFVSVAQVTVPLKVWSRPR